MILWYLVTKQQQLVRDSYECFCRWQHHTTAGVPTPRGLTLGISLHRILHRNSGWSSGGKVACLKSFVSFCEI